MNYIEVTCPKCEISTNVEIGTEEWGAGLAFVGVFVLLFVLLALMAV